MNTITPQELEAKHANDENITLIDVRTPLEFKSIHIPFAKNIPLDTIGKAPLEELDNPTGKVAYIICHSGARAETACKKLIDMGHQNIIKVTGGTVGWKSAGLPVNEDARGVSLERQVRIAAGLLVVAGVVLSLNFHVGYLALSAFVGLGLIYAGITDSCGMAAILARMPWNK